MKKLIFILTLATISLAIWGCRGMWGGGPELTGIDRVDLLNLHNVARGVPLEMDVFCERAAQDQADWMAANHLLLHERPLSYKNRSVGDRLKKQWSTVGENIAMGQETPTEVTNDWLNSSGHRKNIKNTNFKYVGFGIAKSKRDEKYWCTVFSD